MLLLKLTKVERINYQSNGYRDDDEGDRAQTTPVEVTRPVYLAADKIRNFQPRRDNRPGSRLTFIDGGGYAVQETVAEILGFLEADVRGRSAEVVEISDAQSHEGRQH